MVLPSFFKYPQEFILNGQNGCKASETWEIQIGIKPTGSGGFSGLVRASFLISPDQGPVPAPTHPGCPL